ncbi:hypothetical protein [uncultured Croceitalea sp.]|uniref:hypothetical protein n=1 Tax=uncultured Croceitalea sp. TaxID=1798908 RepID=UPI00330692D7
MVILKKIRSATLMETMVSTVLLVVIFMVASLVMNALIAAKSNGDTQPVKERMLELEYQYVSEKLVVPYFEEWENWEIEIVQQNQQGREYVYFKASKPDTKKNITSILTARE